MKRKLLIAAIAAICLAVVPLAVTAEPAGTKAVAGNKAASSAVIQHVVVIYMENHSFDNVLGFWCNQNPGRCPDGGMPSTVTLSNGATVTPSTTPDIVPVVDHIVASQLKAMDNGKMDGWQNISGCAAPAYKCISGYQPSAVPNLTNLASSFAISDNTFSMSDSPSWGGHLYVAMPSTDNFTGEIPTSEKGPGWGCDSQGVAAWLGPHGGTHYVPSCIPDYNLALPNGGAFEPTPAAYHSTIFDELDAANLPWRIYGQSQPVTGGGWPGWGNGGWIWSICPSFAECLYTNQRNNLVDNSQFFTDASSGNLPAYSIVTAGGTAGGTNPAGASGGVQASCHNQFSMTVCDNFIGSLVNAVESSPDWPSTAVFITFDDCGCFYDQVKPGVNPDFTQQGPRTPLIIVSPYAKPGYTDTTATTFSGILAYTEQNFGLSPLGPNDAVAYPFTNAFDYTQAPLSRVKMVNSSVPAGSRNIKITRVLANDPT